MHHHGAADHRFVIIREGNLTVHIIQYGFARRVRFDIPHVALVPRGGIGSGMRLVSGIEMAACGTRVSCAAISELVDVKAVLPRREAGDLRVDPDTIGDRGKRDGAGHFIPGGGMQRRDGL